MYVWMTFNRDKKPIVFNDDANIVTTFQQSVKLTYSSLKNVKIEYVINPNSMFAHITIPPQEEKEEEIKETIGIRQYPVLNQVNHL